MPDDPLVCYARACLTTYRDHDLIPLLAYSLTCAIARQRHEAIAEILDDLTTEVAALATAHLLERRH